MKRNINLKIIVILFFIAAVAILLNKNVVAKKETDSLRLASKSSLSLEVDSDLVQELYSKLTLLQEGGIEDDHYRDLYFDFSGKEKVFSSEDELFIALDDLYRNGKLNESEDTEVFTYSTDVSSVVDKVYALFKDENFDPSASPLVSSYDCGITGYLYTGTSYELSVTSCENVSYSFETRLENAIKDGNYINLTLKALRIFKDEEKFTIKNFSRDDELASGEYEKLEELEDEILSMDEVDEYVFSFELKGDDYYLASIERI